jgi:hypothetical protein
VHPVGPSHGRKRRGRPYSCPWWADEQVFALAFMQGNGGEIPRDPGIRTRGRGPEIRASAAAVLFRALWRSFFGTRKTNRNRSAAGFADASCWCQLSPLLPADTDTLVKAGPDLGEVHSKSGFLI